MNNQINPRAKDKFKKLPGMENGDNARSEYEVRADALTAKIARLKALRLARDAAVLAAPPAPVKKKASKKKAIKKKKRAPVSPAASLTDWLKNHHAKNQQAG
jgi:hypothetical protein